MDSGKGGFPDFSWRTPVLPTLISKLKEHKPTTSRKNAPINHLPRVGGKAYMSAQMFKHLQLRNVAFQRGITALLIAHLLVIMAMTVCPELHHWAHHDSDCPDHECAVTLFAHGGCDGAPAAVVLVVFLAVLRQCLQQRGDIWVGNLFLSRRVLEHAPPALA